MKVLVDMNLSPEWIPLLKSNGWEAVHWSEIGPPNAPDSEIFSHARQSGQVVFTQDLDFAQLLFATNDTGPSVILLRIADEFGVSTRTRVVNALASAVADLESGALLTISSLHARLRRLPIHPDSV